MASKIRRILSVAKREFFPKPKTANEVELERLRSHPRYINTETNLLGNKIVMPDATSFLFIYDELFNKQIYNFKNTESIPFILDCGANIGLSVIYFKKLFPQAEIVAFEPDAKIFEYLKLNVESFGLSDVTLLKKACWKEETVLQFFSEGADAGRTALSNETQNVVEVKALPLRDFLKRKVSMLKMDIEGAEYVVLNDVKDHLQYVENIFVEYHSFIEKEQFLPEIVSILKNAGFRLHINAPGLTSPHPFVEVTEYNGMDNQINIFGFRD
jgi:FkbM family methyltransferase